MRTELAALAVIALTASTARAEPEWGAEVNVLSPFVPGGLFEARVTRVIWEHGELLIGAHSDFSNTWRDKEGDRSDVGPQFGYRQYIWRGLHVQAYLNAEYATVHNDLADGMDHSSFALFGGAQAGYRYDLDERFYVMAQAGAGLKFYYASPWPHPGGSDTVVPLIGLLAGARL